MGNYISANGGKYIHHPFVGPRRMIFPYTIMARFAQFPFVYHYRYTTLGKPFVFAVCFVYFVNYNIDKVVNSESNIEKWREIRKEWYTRKPHPENDYF